MIREYKYPPRVIVSFLGTLNAGILIDYLLQVYTKTPEFLKPEYIAVSGFVVIFGFFSAIYTIYAVFRIVCGPGKDVHQEFNDEMEMADRKH